MSGLTPWINDISLILIIALCALFGFKKGMLGTLVLGIKLLLVRLLLSIFFTADAESLSGTPFSQQDIWFEAAAAFAASFVLFKILDLLTSFLELVPFIHSKVLGLGLGVLLGYFSLAYLISTVPLVNNHFQKSRLLFVFEYGGAPEKRFLKTVDRSVGKNIVPQLKKRINQSKSEVISRLKKNED